MVRKFAVIVSLSVAMCCVVGTFWSASQVPQFYRQELRREVAPEVRRQQAEELVEQTLQLVKEIQQADHWSERFTEEQVNSWLVEKLPQQKSKWLPPGVSQPRVKFSEETIQLAFHYEYQRWSTVVSCEIRPHMTEPNVLAVEIRGAHAGLIPLPLENVLTEISARLKKAGWPVQRTKSGGYDVFLVDLNRTGGDQPVLEAVDLEQGALELSGSRKPADGEQLAEILESYVSLP